MSERPVLAAIGAFTLVQILGQGVIFLLWGRGTLVFQGPPEFEAALFPAAIAGALVAMPTRSPRVLLAYLLYALTFPALAFARTAAWWGQATTADPFRRPSALLEPILLHWPLAIGVLVGLVFLAAPRGRATASATLQAGGVFGLGLMLLGLTEIAVSVALPAPALEWVFVALQFVIAAITGGFLRGRWRSALLLAAILVLGWLPLGELQARDFLAEGPEGAFRFFVSPATAALIPLASLPRWRSRVGGLALKRA